MKKVAPVIMLLLFVLAACSAPVEDPGLETPAATETPVILPTPTPTEEPPVVLTVCTTSIPETLFPYGGETTASKVRILSLLYPPAFTTDQDSLQPLILEKVPSQNDGDLRLEPVVIRRGQTVADVRGKLVTATEGVQVRPSGCREMGCAITWDGVTPLEMDQMVIDFRLREGLAWSDGTPVTAGDSVLSFRLASAQDSPNYGWAEEHTQGYSAFDDRTLAWVGYPGFASADMERFFWVPLPAHAFDTGADFAQVAGAEMWRSVPISYGSFVLGEWGAEEIRLVRNPHDVTGYPDADQVVLRMVEGGAQGGWGEVQAGTCDVLDESFRMVGQPDLLAEIDAAENIELRVKPGDSWTQLVFGVQPAEYDALTNPLFATRLDYFDDMRTRQGIAACLDRPAMQALLLQGWGAAWPSFLPPEASLLDAAEGIAYDPEKGAALLEAVGWQDHDGDPTTARIAQGVATVFDGRPFSIELLVGPSAFHQDLAGIIQESLARCGLGVDVQTLSLADLYAPGPEGPLFGRNFDLALIAWAPMPSPDCGLYASWEIPVSGNGWIGTNIAGFSDAEYDQACTAAALALPDEYGALLARAEAAFVELLPAVPLFAPPSVEVRGDSW
jgi:peptide/nickel transport system substrate-binding protein